VDNSLVIALAKNPVFHDRSKHIDIQFHYLRDYITNKEVEVKDVKIQDQVIYFHKATQTWCFCQPERYTMSYQKSSLRRDVENKPDFWFF
jgi:hypothetical protein